MSAPLHCCRRHHRGRPRNALDASHPTPLTAIATRPAVHTVDPFGGVDPLDRFRLLHPVHRECRLGALHRVGRVGRLGTEHRLVRQPRVCAVGALAVVSDVVEGVARLPAGTPPPHGHRGGTGPRPGRNRARPVLTRSGQGVRPARGQELPSYFSISPLNFVSSRRSSPRSWSLHSAMMRSTPFRPSARSA